MQTITTEKASLTAIVFNSIEAKRQPVPPISRMEANVRNNQEFLNNSKKAYIERSIFFFNVKRYRKQRMLKMK